LPLFPILTLNLEAAKAANVLATPTGTGQSSGRREIPRQELIAPEAFEEIPSIRR
jgi:hypothetical protein